MMTLYLVIECMVGAALLFGLVIIGVLSFLYYPEARRLGEARKPDTRLQGLPETDEQGLGGR